MVSMSRRFKFKHNTIYYPVLCVLTLCLVFAIANLSNKNQLVRAEEITPSYIERGTNIKNILLETQQEDKTREQRVQSLYSTVKEHNQNLLLLEVNTPDGIKSIYGENIDDQTAEMLSNLQKVTTLTRVRFAKVSELYFQIITRLNKHIDDRENFGFDVSLYISSLEDIEHNIIIAEEKSESIIFELPSKESISPNYIQTELERTQKTADEVQQDYLNIQAQIAQLVESIKDGE